MARASAGATCSPCASSISASQKSKHCLDFCHGAIVGRQYRINIAGRHLYVDLVFYHRILKCFVLIDLKRGEIQHEDIGQMNLYLNYFKSEENTEGDNEPIGIVLGSSKNRLLMEYALQGITNKLFAARYQLYLPKREELEQELHRVLEQKDTGK